MVPLESLTTEAKVFIFPGSRKFFPAEIPEFEEGLREFCESFQELSIAYAIRYDRFIVFAVDDSKAMGLDEHNKIVDFIQGLEKQYQLNLLDKVNVCFKQGPYVQMKEIPDFKNLIKNKGVSKNTVVFDNMITTKFEYDNFWEVPAGNSWLSHFF